MATMTEPTDETQPHRTQPQPDAAATPTTAATSAADAVPSPTPPTQADPSPSPPLKADPNRPASDWREPPWIPPATRRDRGPSLAAIVFGLIVLGVGLYYFVDRTLGIALPAIRWGNLWPLLLVLVGGLILVRAMGRNR
jgi:hypothetical protein